MTKKKDIDFLKGWASAPIDNISSEPLCMEFVAMDGTKHRAEKDDTVSMTLSQEFALVKINNGKPFKMANLAARSKS